MTQTQSNEQETIIRFSSAWWGYIFCRLGLLRALVNGVEDALAITGRFLLLVFLIYCGAEAGLLLTNPNFSFPGWLQMGMFCLQLAGLEGSIPGLARQADALRAQNNEDAARKVESVMLSARAMTVLAIAEGALHALHVPPMALQIISAVLLVVRGVVITGFLIALAKMENKAPRVLSKDAHAREQEAQRERSEQAHMIAALRTQLDEARSALSSVRQKAQESEIDQAQIIRQLREQIAQIEATNASLLSGTEGQGDIIRNLQNQFASAQQQVQNLTASLEQKDRDFERVSADLQTAQLHITNLHIAENETAKLREDYQALSANLQTANLHIADLTTKLERAKNKLADLQSSAAQPGQPRSPKAVGQQAEKITSIDEARARHDGGRVKISHEEVLAFKAAHPTLKNAEVAAQLGISERKVYDAIAWGKEQERAAAIH